MNAEILDRWWDDPASPVSSRANRLAWLAFIGGSLLIFELTSTPSLAVSLGCLKFGWHDIVRRTRDLDRADPDRVEGTYARASRSPGDS